VVERYYTDPENDIYLESCLKYSLIKIQGEEGTNKEKENPYVMAISMNLECSSGALLPTRYDLPCCSGNGRNSWPMRR